MNDYILKSIYNLRVQILHAKQSACLAVPVRKIICQTQMVFQNLLRLYVNKIMYLNFCAQKGWQAAYEGQNPDNNNYRYSSTSTRSSFQRIDNSNIAIY